MACRTALRASVLVALLCTTATWADPVEWLALSQPATPAAQADALSQESKPKPTAAPTPKPEGPWAGDPSRFFQGALLGFLGHEMGHVVANYAVGSDPYLMRVDFGFIPFFTIQPDRLLTHREHYLTASAGFNAENLINEWLLVKHPNLADEDEPLLKGMATFNFCLTVGYALDAFTGFGPDERDTKGMADSLGWSEEAVGVLILGPALLDGYRFRHPDCKWARDTSRVLKLLMLGLALSADSD
ncbi:hypothetical protein LLH03_13905 [bacterium]|nr:hypothetical protein [bacterium]